MVEVKYKITNNWKNQIESNDEIGHKILMWKIQTGKTTSSDK